MRRGHLPDAEGVGPVVGNAPVTQGETAWLPLGLRARSQGTGHCCGGSGPAGAPPD